MDVSKEYIEMCEKAQEIQNLREVKERVLTDKDKCNHKLGDFSLWLNSDYCYCEFSKNNALYNNNIKSDISIFSDIFNSFLNYSKCIHFLESYSKLIWLPRQDQLQEMLDLTNKVSWCFSTGLTPVCRCEYGGGYDKETEKELNYFDSFSSFEQSWLAFVMKEKYSKTWNKETKEWVKL